MTKPVDYTKYHEMTSPDLAEIIRKKDERIQELQEHANVRLEHLRAAKRDNVRLVRTIEALTKGFTE